MEDKFFRGKKVLVMGLGLLGGGIATTKWLVRHGAIVTVTDLKNRRELVSSIRDLGPAAKKVKFVLGRHRVSDFKRADMVVVNPAVPREGKFLKIARDSGAQLENEASLFFRFCKNPIIGVTGTRGKTTTANWIFYLLKKAGGYKSAVITGNSSESPMLKVLDGLDGRSPVVVELSSWHLELLPEARKSPTISIVTNLYRDHMNRYKSMGDYARAKANIFRFQSKSDLLLLAKKDKWTPAFKSFHTKWKAPSGMSYFPKNIKGVSKNKFISKYGPHNWINFTSAAMAAGRFGVSQKKIARLAFSLPQIALRQEPILESSGLLIINDSTATSPDGAIAAIKRFSQKKNELILIAGGTDKNLEYGGWAGVVRKHIKPQSLLLLNGSATKKMVFALGEIGYFKNATPQIFENLPEILRVIKKFKLGIDFGKSTSCKSRAVILFSPGAASFGKFKNEFDRGDSFNVYCKKFFG